MLQPDSQTRRITNYAEAMQFSGNTALLCMEYDSNWEAGYTFAQYANAPVILVVKTLDHITQYDYLASQRVQVTAVIRGEQVSEGDVIEILDYGFANNYLGLAFYSATNVLKPEREYLVFLSELSVRNQVVALPCFRSKIYGPWAFILGEDTTELIHGEESTVPYQQVKDNCYFTSIPKLYDAIREMRLQCLEYAGCD